MRKKTVDAGTRALVGAVIGALLSEPGDRTVGAFVGAFIGLASGTRTQVYPVVYTLSAPDVFELPRKAWSTK